MNGGLTETDRKAFNGSSIGARIRADLRSSGGLDVAQRSAPNAADAKDGNAETHTGTGYVDAQSARAAKKRQDAKSSGEIL